VLAEVQLVDDRPGGIRRRFSVACWWTSRRAIRSRSSCTSLALLGTAVLASAAPALHAARVDPMASLKAE